SVKAFLFQSVRFAVFKEIRNQNLRKSHEEHLSPKQSSRDPAELLLEKEVSQLVNEAIDSLPERCREVFMLSRFENLKVREIAARLNISPKSVENQITIANYKLKNYLNEAFTIFLLMEFHNFFE